jgi:signal peptidase I
MNDSHDPYNTPPDPDRFAPPDRTDADTEFRTPETFPHHAEAGTPQSAITPSMEPEPTYEHARVEEHGRIGRGDALPPLEPLPVMAGNFASAGTNTMPESASLSSRLVDEFVAWLKTLASAAVYATLIVTFGFQVARVEGQSMAPTLEDQDRLIVNKLAYRLGDPQVGDIVMLYYPLNPDKSFVKRVIAKYNQRVRIVDGKVYVNDVPVDDSFVPEQYRSHEDWGPEIVPEGYYFVMGDHRNNSSDSRHWGFVPKKYIIGRVQLRWWPVPDARTF